MHLYQLAASPQYSANMVAHSLFGAVWLSRGDNLNSDIVCHLLPSEIFSQRRFNFRICRNSLLSESTG
jgi:hypothetical protein